MEYAASDTVEFGTNAREGLTPGEIHLWQIDLDDREAMPAYEAASLDAGERARAARFVRDRDRAWFVGRRAWLRRLLASYLGVPAASIDYRLIANDKPVLAPACNARDLHFNLSHSSGLALCAVGVGDPIGVDVERLRAMPDYLDIARRHFGSREFDCVRAAGDANAVPVFFDCWTRKEAFIKATGEGLSRELDSFDVALHEPVCAQVLESTGDGRPWFVYRLSPGPGVAAALCSRLPAARLRWHRLPPGPPPGDRPATR